MKIPVSVIITIKNEAHNITRCLGALRAFDEIIVVDSDSYDGTKTLAEKAGVRVVNFTWNKAYPKKRQYCLDNLDLAHEWVFFVDADEVVTEEVVEEIRGIFCHYDPCEGGKNESQKMSVRSCVQVPDGKAFAGYFVKGRYVLDGTVLKHGLQNNKLCLFDRRKIEFPVVDDLDIPSMGEIEGHYQPVLKAEYAGGAIGQLRNSLLHYAFDDDAGWHARHERYARWEKEMILRDAYPKDPVPVRAFLKALFRHAPFRAEIAFMHCYLWKRGALDGAAGWRFAKSRWNYYRMLRKSQ